MYLKYARQKGLETEIAEEQEGLISISVFINGRSQYQNKQTALRIIASKLADIKQQESEETIQNTRKNQIDEGGRSNKIRTYNFINGYAIDHQSGKKLTPSKR